MKRTSVPSPFETYAYLLDTRFVRKSDGKNITDIASDDAQVICCHRMVDILSHIPKPHKVTLRHMTTPSTTWNIFCET